MTKDDFINSLTLAELRYVVGQFWEWYNADGCPINKEKQEDTEEFDCNGDCWECDGGLEQIGCWVQFYVWKYRNNKNKETRDNGK